MYLDVQQYVSAIDDVPFGFGSQPARFAGQLDMDEIMRPIGRLVRKKMSRLPVEEIEALDSRLNDQYLRLCRLVHIENPHFWDLLADESEEHLAMPQYCSAGSTDEAVLTVIQCRRTWQESEDAIMMIASDTIDFLPPPVSTTSGLASTRTGGTPTSSSINHLSLAVTTAAAGPPTIEKRIGTGKAFPAKFENSLRKSPTELFPARSVGTQSHSRYVHMHNQQHVLVYTDGACSNNGQPGKNPQGGWAVVYGPPLGDGRGTTSQSVSGRLEIAGPTGAKYIATSNRAELRAAIAALRLTNWRAEGFTSIIIATDSSYVMDGATDWARSWVRKGWCKNSGEPVKNRDLWELLLGEVERLDEKGLRVEIWKIRRELNVAADAAAKKASNLATAEPEFKDTAMAAMAKSDSTDDAGVLNAGLSMLVTGSSDQGSSGESTGTTHVLVLCVEQQSVFESVYSNLIQRIKTLSRMQVAATEQAALALLAADQQQANPSVIFVADGAVTRRKKLRDAVIQRLNAGATVVLAGCFSSFTNAADIKRLMSAIGLPWEQGTYERTTTALRADLRGQANSNLYNSYSQKAMHLQNVDTSSVWYTNEYDHQQVAVAFTKLAGRRGKLGYVGDVNREDATGKVVLAMCGLVDCNAV
ncbi:hypothetical protein BX600DRAFT_466543, partial [Xylariales sp. PMI_506]